MISRTDEIMWAKLRLDPNKYKRVELPTCVTNILKKKKGGQVLVSFILNLDGRDTMILSYMSFQNETPLCKAGYACPVNPTLQGVSPEFIWEYLAREIAQSWSEYAIKK